jgi:hydrogenase maturation protein HypF
MVTVPDSEKMNRRIKIIIRGAVQGVGFRPFVYRLANRFGLCGYVLNSGRGVFIEAEGPKSSLDRFLITLQDEKPVHAIIHSLEFSYLDVSGFSDFMIRKSRDEEEISAFIMPDIAVCEECLQEMFDPSDRRYLYPFINCTHCGPRFSIIESLPYDRPNTSMKIFSMCDSCREEYQDPFNRRFHAQPIACPNCGPQLQLWDGAGKVLADRHEALLQAVERIRGGKTVALKGLGGFHLIADATNRKAVERLRLRKHREEKPFAVMVPSPEVARELCKISEFEVRLLTSPESPIVLLNRKKNSTLSEALYHANIAPGNPNLGIMLPYTPLHHLLLKELNIPVVATSGNISEEPMVIDEYQAIRTLGGIADVFLVHNRPIVRHVDDSIARIILGGEMILRRARGYAPLPLSLTRKIEKPLKRQSILAVGAHLKNTISITGSDQVFISQHIGDLATRESLATFEKVISDFQCLYQIQPETVAADLHPDYLSSKYARGLQLPVIGIQHHQAHIAACRVENQVTGRALGVSWDGTGFGPDHTVWGGEFFMTDDDSYRRVARLQQFMLPGGEEAVKEPRRAAAGVLYEILGDELFSNHLFISKHFNPREQTLLIRMLEKRLNSPVTSSAGRLFDAVASLLNLRQKNAYEGQAAMMLEFLADRQESSRYEIQLTEHDTVVIEWEPMIRQILNDIEEGRDPAKIAMRFHNALCEGIVRAAVYFNTEKVLLSGGCFQNIILLEKTVKQLQKKGFRPYWHQRIPPNDGGISVGQIVLAGMKAKSPEPVSQTANEINLKYS